MSSLRNWIARCAAARAFLRTERLRATEPIDRIRSNDGSQHIQRELNTSGNTVTIIQSGFKKGLSPRSVQLMNTCSLSDYIFLLTLQPVWLLKSRSWRPKQNPQTFHPVPRSICISTHEATLVRAEHTGSFAVVPGSILDFLRRLILAVLLQLSLSFLLRP